MAYVSEKLYNAIFSNVLNDLAIAVDLTGGAVKLDTVFEEIEGAFAREGLDIEGTSEDIERMASEIVGVLMEEGYTIL